MLTCLSVQQELTCSLQSFSHPSRRLQISWICLLTVTYLRAVTGTAKSLILLNGEVDGGVTFPCLDTEQKSISSFYLQKGDDFVNGYHKFHPIPTAKWKNTILDSIQNVYMNHLTVSHAGTYTCHIQYNNMTSDEKPIQLSVTANYTKPNVTVSYSDADHNCRVTCSSYGGYPKNKFSWDVHALGDASGQMWRTEETRSECDPKTKLWNISSTASFNCSFGLRRNLSCYVDNTELSSTFLICEYRKSSVKTVAERKDQHKSPLYHNRFFTFKSWPTFRKCEGQWKPL